MKTQLPPIVHVTVWKDWSEILNQRIELLLNNGLAGLILVLGILALFLEVRLAIWVAMGILVSFLGALLFMPIFDVSINMLSLFAFIMVLGVVMDDRVLLAAVDKVRESLSSFAGVEEINDSYTPGKQELKLRLKPEAATLGITESDLAMQVRGAFYGAEALRLQRGQNEVKVMVRYPETERRSMDDIKNLRIRTPSGGEVPFYQAAYVEETQGFSAIERTDRKRVIHVTAKVNPPVTTSDEVLAELVLTLLDPLVHDYPGLSYDLEGQSREQRESMGSLKIGFLLAQFLIYSLLAILFRSYTQPLVVMSAIPFGIVGAVIGHIVLGYNLSLISGFGIVALTGVVVNDSLVMIDFINRARREEGMTLREAVLQSGVRRFRPIIMTSLTTFFGLAPIILEPSIQVRFMIPMAISLGCGVLFATAITLVIIPALYMILEDILTIFNRGEDRKLQSNVMYSPELPEPAKSYES